MLEVPSLREELNRKSLEAMEWLIDAASKGLISEAQFSTGVDALWMALAGLVNKEFLALVTDASELALEADKDVCKVFMNATKMVVVRWTPGSKNVELLTFEEVKTIKAEPDEVQAKVQGLIKRLADAGYQEV